MKRIRSGLAGFSFVIVMLCAFGAAAVESGSKAPEIGLTDQAGKPVTMGDLKGKVVLVDFWASWCGPCREELPELEALHKKYGDKGLVVVGVNADSDRDNMDKFLRRTKLSFRVVFDESRAVAGRYAPHKMPSSYLVDKKGLVRFVHGGYRSGDEKALETEIKQLLAE